MHRQEQLISAFLVLLQIPMMRIPALDRNDGRGFISLFRLLLNPDAFWNGISECDGRRCGNSQSDDREKQIHKLRFSMTPHLIKSSFALGKRPA